MSGGGPVVDEGAIGVRRDRLPTTGEYPPLFALMGAHGGSGVTTLAQLWAPAADSGRCWPGNSLTTQAVYVVARAHMSGIAAAADVLRVAADGAAPAGVDVHGLIVVAAHPGRVHKDVRRYAATIGELVPHTYHVPWVPALVPVLTRQLPSWRPADGVQTTKRSESGDLATVPSSIASICQAMLDDFAADLPVAASETNQ